MASTITVLDDSGTGIPQVIPILPAQGAAAQAASLPVTLATDVGLPYPGATIPAASTSLEANHIFRTTPGILLSLTVSIGATGGWVLIFDQATVPADGSVTPKWWAYVTSNGVGGYVSMSWMKAPLYFATGIVATFSTTGPFTKTASATAAFTSQHTTVGPIVYQVPHLVETGTRAPVADANYTMGATDRVIGYTSISVARTVTLVAANSFLPGEGVLIVDESGTASSSHKITALPSGTDHISGTTSFDVVTAAYGSRLLISNGFNAWFTA